MSDYRLNDFYFREHIEPKLSCVIENQLNNCNLKSFTGGKHLRAQLIEKIANDFQIPNDTAKNFGRIAELVHNATLTHDDVIDAAETRRGAPSIPHQLANKRSILVGDYMLASALYELSLFQVPELTKQLTLTLKELVEGEWIQMETTDCFNIDLETYITLANKKTGSLFRWCFVTPYLYRHINKETYDPYHLKCLENFSLILGQIFQMTDDVLDFSHDSGKTYALDLENNNINFVLYFYGQKIKDSVEIKRDLLKQSHRLESAIKDAYLFIQQLVASGEKCLEEIAKEKIFSPQTIDYLSECLNQILLRKK